MCIAVRSYVTSDHVALRIDPVALATCGARNIDGDELPIVQDKPVLVSILTVVETDDGSPRVYAGNPRKGGVGNVDGDEFARLPQETMEYTVTAVVGADNSRRVDDHRGKCSHSARDINLRELASAKEVAVSLKKIIAGKSYAYDIADVADAETSGTRGTGKINGRNLPAVQHIGVPSGIGAIGAHDRSAGIDPRRVG